MKTCNSCHEIKPDNEFNKNRASKDGLTNYCKMCISIYTKKHISEMRVCALPECCKVFASKREATMFCCPKCYDKAKEAGLKVSIIKLQNSPSKWPERAFVGADDVCVVF